MIRFEIIGTGGYVPKKILTNADLEKMVDTSDEWITTRTGIKERHIAREDEATSDMVIKAAEEAINEAKIDREEIDIVIVATVTPDTAFPSASCWVQKGLGIKNIPVFDISAACTGFLYGLIIGGSLIQAGTARTVLVAGSETLTKITDWKDRGTCVLFGDGAGAAILRKTERDAGLLGYTWHANGSLGHLLSLPAGGSRLPASETTVKEGLHFLKMQGNEVFKYAVRYMGESAVNAIKKAGITSEDIKLFIPHQANIRIIQSTCERAGIPMEKTYITIDRYGNMSAATIPVSFRDALREKLIKRDDIVLFSAFGAGFTWASLVLKY